MKTTAALFALSLWLLCGTAQAHPGHSGSHTMQMYGFFWIGVQPKMGAPIGPGSASDFWRKAFVSKYRITGSPSFISGF